MTAKPSDPPRTDERIDEVPEWGPMVSAEFARQLERALAAANAQVEALRKEFDNFKQNTIGVCEAWKREYEGEKERGNLWQAECIAAEARAANAEEGMRERAANVAHGALLLAEIMHAGDHMRVAGSIEEAIRAFPIAISRALPIKAQ